MQEPFYIKKVAVLGAGVMGAQIAAHCINAGVETLLFDLASKEGASNALVDKAIAHLKKLKPTPLATPQTSLLLKACNYQDDLSELKKCDLIIEAIAERMDWKEDLYQRISPHLTQKNILVSNTSSLSINTLAKALPEALRPHFCGLHFFNPPRYMHLVELIPAESTSSTLLNHLETWLTSRMGKGVVRAKDTPNFIANRVGVFSLLVTMHHAQEMQLGLDEIDAITGTLIGRPKSANFRTMDVVGLDTMAHVVHTMQQELTQDPWHQYFYLPDWLMVLIEEGHLGQKTGEGIYRKQGKIIEVYDIQKKQYREALTDVSDALKNILNLSDARERMQALINSSDRQAQFLAACYRDLFHYCAYHIQEIAHSVRDIDFALRWGYGWKEGAFETWQRAGLLDMKQFIEQSITEKKAMSNASLPAWLEKVHHFYTEEGAYSPAEDTFIKRSQLSVYERQFFPDCVLKEPIRHTETLFENEGVRLWHLKDDVAVVSFKSKANTISQSVIDGLNRALDKVEEQCQGLIIYQHDANNFSSGADLRGVANLLKTNQMNALEAMIDDFQKMAMRLKYSVVPTIAAVRGRALGGGCELMMQCDAVVAAFESYPGLVEAGVGLIPAGGGCKEAAMRAAAKAEKAELMDFLQPYFEQIAKAFVAGSAVDGLYHGYLRESDKWVMHHNEVLYAALAKIKAMCAANYNPPLPYRFQVAGREGHARLQIGLVNWLEGGFITKHDYFLANQLASVLCGGDVNAEERVDEAWMLKLEKEAFMTLVETSQTQARIDHLLKTGKPLRN